MRSQVTLLVSLLLLSGALAGCLGDKESAPAPAADDAASVDGEPTADELANITDDGTDEERGADLGHQPHIHDYWMGKERVTLMDEEMTADAFNSLGFTFFNTFRGTPGLGGAFLELPEGKIVYEGTGQLEMTVTWTDATITGMAMQYRTPAESQWSTPQPMTSGTPLAVEVTPEMSDMPHAKDSRWMFLLTPASAGQSMVGTFQVKVDIIKMRDIALFPGHPELFAGEHALTLFKGAGTSSQQNFATSIAGFLTQTSQDDSIVSEKVVPMETRSMTANLTIKSASADVGTVSDVYFLVKSADRNGFRFAEVIDVDEATQTYRFAWLVEMAETDSPYGKESDWRFDVHVTTDPSGGIFDGGCGGCSNVRVEYDAEIVAYDNVVDGAKELRGGGRGG